MAHSILFYGNEASVLKWRALIVERAAVECGEVEVAPNETIVRHRFEATMTAEQIKTLSPAWYEPSGTGADSNGRPYLWYACVSLIEKSCLRRLQTPVAAR